MLDCTTLSTALLSADATATAVDVLSEFLFLSSPPPHAAATTATESAVARTTTPDARLYHLILSTMLSPLVRYLLVSIQRAYA